MTPDLAPVADDFETWKRCADTIPTLVVACRADGSVEFVNRRWQAVLGHDLTALSGERWAALLHPADRARVVVRARKAFAELGTYDDEIRLRYADDSYRWLAISLEPSFDACGALVRWTGVLSEIDERKRTEGELRALVQSISQMLWATDSSGAVDWYNERYYAFTGQSREEARGWGWQSAHHPADLPLVIESWTHALASGGALDFESRLRGVDGRYRWFLSRGEPVRDGDGRVVRWYGTMTDIDEQRRTLSRTRRITETLQNAFLPKRLPEDPNLRIDAVYVAAERDALVGGDWYDAFELPDGRLLFSIGDVMGHGIEASVTVGRLRQAILTLAFDEDDPAVVLAKTNAILRSQDDTIATAVVGFVNHARSALVYACAGHPPPIVASPGSAVRALPYGGVPLGVLDGLSVPTERIDAIAPGSIVVLYTDGITEFARDVESAEIALKEAVGRRVGDVTSARPARDILADVLGDATPVDDTALLFMQFAHVEAAVRHSTDAIDPVATWRFHSSDAASASRIRRRVVGYLRRLARAHADLADLELVLGEILANTVEHAPGLVEIDVDWRGDDLRMAVTDSGTTLARIDTSSLPDPFDENGRGLALVRMLAASAEVDRATDGGNIVRVSFALTRR